MLALVYATAAAHTYCTHTCRFCIASLCILLRFVWRKVILLADYVYQQDRKAQKAFAFVSSYNQLTATTAYLYMCVCVCSTFALAWLSRADFLERNRCTKLRLDEIRAALRQTLAKTTR